MKDGVWRFGVTEFTTGMMNEGWSLDCMLNLVRDLEGKWSFV
jgi:hypothetical protein